MYATSMKKTLFIFTIIGLGIFGVVPVNAQYYDAQFYQSASYPTTYTNTGYYNNSYNNQSYNNNYSSYYMGGTGSYTIGCTTYYYSTRTGAQLYTQNICTSYNYHDTSFYSYTNPYYVYQYEGGSWYPGYYSGEYTNTGYGYNYGNNNYGSSCYLQNGYQVCY